MVVILHGQEISTACRTVLLTLNALGLEFKIKKVQTANLATEEFRKKNPLQLIPVLEDEGHFIGDSHAISAYLVRKYGQNDSLYPKDFKQRALVDQRLYFNSGVLFAALIRAAIRIFKYNEKGISLDRYDDIINGYSLLETFLVHNYVAGDSLTIADFSILATMSSLNVFVPIDVKKYPKVTAWMELMTKLPYYERGNELGLALFAKKYESIISNE